MGTLLSCLCVSRVLYADVDDTRMKLRYELQFHSTPILTLCSFRIIKAMKSWLSFRLIVPLPFMLLMGRIQRCAIRLAELLFYIFRGY